MSGAALAVAPERTDAHPNRRRLPAPSGGEATLEHRLISARETLSAAGLVACPVCGGDMKGRHAGGACTDCGTVLT